MKLKSKLSCDVYLRQMHYNLSSFTDFGRERFVGVVFGRFFFITHHADFEWNRRITGEMHNAIGFVKPEDTGTKVYCLRTAGALNPTSLLGIFCLCLLCTLVSGYLVEQTEVAVIVALATTLLVTCVTAITDSLTEEGQAGREMLTAYLTDPSDYYALL